VGGVRWFRAVLPAIGVMAVEGCTPSYIPVDPAEEGARVVLDTPWCAEVGRGSPALDVEEVAGGLEVPWGMAFLPDGRMLFTERAGRIRVMGAEGVEPEPWAEVEAYSLDEGGLMGIAASPEFARDGHVYIVTSYWQGGRGLPARVWRRVLGVLVPGVVHPVRLRILRFTEREGRGVDPVILWEGIPTARLHAGGGLAFGPDGMLYLGTGDAQRPALAQDPASLVGKVLRITPEGKVPRDNPDPTSPVVASGVRSVQGIDWLPDGTGLFIDHGPTGLPWEDGRVHRDELNPLLLGGNYGWPAVSGMVEHPEHLSPLVEWTPAVAPGGLLVYRGSLLPWRGDVLVGGLRGVQLRRVVLESGPGGAIDVVCEEILLEGLLGRLRGVAEGPDGSVYLTTSNRDGRGGEPAPGDDRILRVTPTGP